MAQVSPLTLILIAGLLEGLPVCAQQNELRSLANSLAPDIATAGKKTIAVVDFVDLQGNTSELGRFLAEEFSVALARTHKGFEVVERNQLKAILAEHKLTATGLIDQATAKKLGEFAGADAIVTGSLTPFSESVRVAVKVLATDSARIITADDIDLPKTQTIVELLGNLIGGPQSPRRPNDRPPAANSSGRGLPAGNAVSSSPVVVAEQFQYELLECRGMATSVKCTIRITNRGPDRSVLHNCGRYIVNTKAYDNSGNESPGESCTISGKGPADGVIAQLISGIAVQATILFQNLSASASSLSLINIMGGWDSSGYNTLVWHDYTVSFRNVPIVR